MLRPFVQYLSNITPKTHTLRKCKKKTFVRMKKKGVSKISSKSMLTEAVVDDKFIKLNVKDDSTSKLKQLAIMREENLKLMSSHSPALDSKLDNLTKEEFKKIKLSNKINMYEEPLMLFSLMKEAQFKSSENRIDESIDKKFDQNILRFHLMSNEQRKKELKPFNIERQINEQFDVQVNSYKFI